MSIQDISKTIVIQKSTSNTLYIYMYVCIYLYIYMMMMILGLCALKLGSCRPLRSCGKKIIIK